MKLHAIRLLLLDRFTQFVPNLINVRGVLAIPFMQVPLLCYITGCMPGKLSGKIVLKLLLSITGCVNVDC